MYSKKFFRFVMPSILAFALSGIYSIVDGYFVGNNVGDAGMTAINEFFLLFLYYRHSEPA